MSYPTPDPSTYLPEWMRAKFQPVPHRSEEVVAENPIVHDLEERVKVMRRLGIKRLNMSGMDVELDGWVP